MNVDPKYAPALVRGLCLWLQLVRRMAPFLQLASSMASVFALALCSTPYGAPPGDFVRLDCSNLVAETFLSSGCVHTDLFGSRLEFSQAGRVAGKSEKVSIFERWCFPVIWI